MTWGVTCSSCDKKYSFIHRKNVLWHKVLLFIPVTGNRFCVTRNILSFTGRNPSVTDIVLLLPQEVFFLSQEVFLVTCVYFIMRLEMFLLLQGVLCKSHEEYFLSQEWFFILFCHKRYFPVIQNNYFFLGQKVYFL